MTLRTEASSDRDLMRAQLGRAATGREVLNFSSSENFDRDFMSSRSPSSRFKFNPRDDNTFENSFLSALTASIGKGALLDPTQRQVHQKSRRPKLSEKLLTNTTTASHSSVFGQRLSDGDQRPGDAPKLAVTEVTCRVTNADLHGLSRSCPSRPSCPFQALIRGCDLGRPRD